MSARVTVKAPGKVNVHLSVGPVGDDGYHPLATVFQAVALWETVRATSRTDGQITVAVRGSTTVTVVDGDVPLDDSNLAVKAARLMAQHYGIHDGVDLDITKGVPVAGGMAGGSADAAATLVACNELWSVGASKSELIALAGQVGADVPFVLQGHTAVGLGRGDHLTPAMAHGQFHWVFATQDRGLSTPQVYAEFDRQVATGQREATAPHISTEVMAALMAGDAIALGSVLRNDLQDAAVALAPHLIDVMEAARQAEAAGVMVSGSGPTVAALARSRQHCLAIAAHLRAANVAATVMTASAPASGAVILRESDVTAL